LEGDTFFSTRGAGDEGGGGGREGLQNNRPYKRRKGRESGGDELVEGVLSGVGRGDAWGLRSKGGGETAGRIRDAL